MYPNGIPPAISELDASSLKHGLKRVPEYPLLPRDGRLYSRPVEFYRQGDGSNGEAYRWWDQILAVFSRCALTKDDDKLVAISAVAKYIWVLVGRDRDDYFAGLWRRNLLKHLLWIARPGELGEDQVMGGEARRPAVYCAPSWSWASLHVETYFPHLEEFAGLSPLVEILEVEVQPITADAPGQVARGHLRLRGFLKMFPVAKKDFTNMLDFKNKGYQSEALAYFDDPGARVGSLWWTLPIYAAVSWRERPMAVGLILAKVEDGDHGNHGDQMYQRKGVFTMEDDVFASKEIARASEEISRAVCEELAKESKYASSEDSSDNSMWDTFYPYRLDIPWEEREITII